MKHDNIDTLIDQWHTERPELDPQPMAVVGRIFKLGSILEHRVNEILKPFDLAIWAFDVLATLRRHGKPYAMTPKDLMQATMLSSGAMTNRINRLEDLGYVVREPDSTDRRSLSVCLTPVGLRIINKVIGYRFQEAEDAISKLKANERRTMANLLRTLIVDLENRSDNI